jgi:pimeloyl-ACP methyl ester carboxylesterase
LPSVTLTAYVRSSSATPGHGRWGDLSPPAHGRPCYLAEVEANLARLCRKPALIVGGANDFAFRKPERQRFEQIFPGHRTVVLERARHFIQEDEPGRIASEIRAFVH